MLEGLLLIGLGCGILATARTFAGLHRDVQHSIATRRERYDPGSRVTRFHAWSLRHSTRGQVMFGRGVAIAAIAIGFALLISNDLWGLR